MTFVFRRFGVLLVLTEGRGTRGTPYRNIALTKLRLLTETDEERAMSAPNTDTNGRPVVPAQRARQGVTGHNVRYVLGISTAAVVVAFAAIWIYYFA
jgi:hypothetical protein